MLDQMVSQLPTRLQKRVLVEEERLIFPEVFNPCVSDQFSDEVDLDGPLSADKAIFILMRS